MEQRIKDRYQDAVLQQLMVCYGIAADQIRPLDAFESFIYEFERDGQSYILRISHSLRRTEQMIVGEVDWINYLADGGLSVARAIYSNNGKLVEAVDDGQNGRFLATAFVKATGQPPWDLWSPQLFEAYGQHMGRMHALSTTYQPGSETWRPNWDDEIMEFVERYLPASEPVAKAKYKAVCNHLHTLPTENHCYGMIHQDAHGSNFLVNEAGEITLFDFDECVYSWFANDIAIALFYTVMDADDWVEFTKEFMTCFLRGYRQAHPLEGQWLKEIPYFLKLREIELYAVMHRDFDVNNIDHWWCARFMQDRKRRIEQDVPFIEFDFESLVEG